MFVCLCESFLHIRPSFFSSIFSGAIIGIDDQDVNTFTITVDHKTFHFQVCKFFVPYDDIN
jgi:hypothetical protein